ncbi:MAG: CBS domain-containing protein [Phycisphaerales bacterium]|nr:CBS domain-containing protein [Phycisphaerae bacterium]NNM25743.1 CBS domain-containing protein [Phycisphaerales bacterium]
MLTNALIAPLSRLATTKAPPDRLTDRELRQLVDLSRREGVIDPVEQAVLSEVLTIRRLHVHDVMTPRTRMVALPATADRDDVRRCATESRQTVIPVFRENLDDIVGVLHVKRMLLDETISSVTDRRVLTAAHFVPDLARLDQLLDEFRRGHTRVAVVVDEYGGTEGLVTVEDVVEEVVGDIVRGQAPRPPQLIGLGRWRCWGRTPLHEWTEAFGVRVDSSVATLAGFVTERLDRPPLPDDLVELDGLRLEVETVEDRQAASILVVIDDAATDGGPGAPSGASPGGTP